MNYYDVVLLLVPVSFLGISGTAFFGGLSVEVALMVGGVFSVAIIGHAMFANPPVDPLPTSSNTETSTPSQKMTDSAVSQD